MYKKFEVNRTKIKEGCQSCIKAAHQDSKSDLPLEFCMNWDLTLILNWNTDAIIKNHLVKNETIMTRPGIYYSADNNRI